MKSIEIEPASWTQVRAMGEDHVIIEEDVLDIVKELKEISPTLHVRWSHGNGDPFYALYTKELVKGKETEYLVTTFKHLDSRVPARVRYIMSADHNFVKEMDKLDDKQDHDHNYKMAQLFGEGAEKLASALRKDFEVKDRIFVPNGN